MIFKQFSGPSVGQWIDFPGANQGDAPTRLRVLQVDDMSVRPLWLAKFLQHPDKPRSRFRVTAYDPSAHRCRTLYLDGNPPRRASPEQTATTSRAQLQLGVWCFESKTVLSSHGRRYQQTAHDLAILTATCRAILTGDRRQKTKNTRTTLALFLFD